MKLRLIIVIATLAFGAVSCQKETSTPEPEKTVDYRLVDSLLSATGRYWVIEKITSVKGNEKLEYISDNGFRTDSLLDIYWHAGYIASANFKFSKGTINQQDGAGPYGPLPYTNAAKFHVDHLSARIRGGWLWSDDHKKASVTPPELLKYILRHISQVDASKFEGYFDPASYPVYGNVEDIKTAQKSERIKIIMNPKENNGKTSYIFTLRAVWLDSKPYGGSRVSVYDKVIY